MAEQEMVTEFDNVLLRWILGKQIIKLHRKHLLRVVYQVAGYFVIRTKSS
jgi:hypothetical protein